MAPSAQFLLGDITMRKILVLCGALVYGIAAAENEVQEENTDCVESNFEGISVSAGIGFSNLKLQNEKDKSKKTKLNSFSGEIGVNYRHNVGNDWLVGLGADVEFASKKKTVNTEITLVETAAANVGAGQAKLKEGNTKFDLETTYETKEIAAVKDDKIKAELKTKRYSVTPELYVSAGKVFCEGRFLPELLLGLSYSGFKFTEKYDQVVATDSSTKNVFNNSVKNRKVAPFVGLKASYAINGNLSVYALAKYKFDTKKNNAKMKDKYSFNAGLSWKF